MELTFRTDLSTLDRVSEFRFSEYEMVHARFDAADRRTLKECDASTSIADKLLALELIARRIEEHRERERKREEKEREARAMAILTGKS